MHAESIIFVIPTVPSDEFDADPGRWDLSGSLLYSPHACMSLSLPPSL
jgi:hypothetical protein